MGSQGLHCTNIMKVFAALLACIAMVSARNLKLDELEVGFCDGANSDVLSLDNISVEPFPLVIATGEDITLNVQITLNEPIPAGATVSFLSALSNTSTNDFAQQNNNTKYTS